MIVARLQDNTSQKLFDYANTFVECREKCCNFDPLEVIPSLSPQDFCSEHDEKIFEALLNLDDKNNILDYKNNIKSLNQSNFSKETYLVLKAFILKKFNQIEEICKKNYPFLTEENIRIIQNEFINELDAVDVSEGLNKKSYLPRLQTLVEHIEQNTSLANMNVFVAEHAYSLKKEKYIIDGLNKLNLSETTHRTLSEFIEKKSNEIEGLCEEYLFLTGENIETIKKEFINELYKIDFDELSKIPNNSINFEQRSLLNSTFNMNAFVMNHANFFAIKNNIKCLASLNEITNLTLKKFIIEKFAEIEECCNDYPFLTTKNIETIRDEFINELNKVDFKSVNEELNKKPDQSCLQTITKHIEQNNPLLNNMFSFVKTHANSFKPYSQQIREFLIEEIEKIKSIIVEYKSKGGKKLFVDDFIQSVDGILHRLNTDINKKDFNNIESIYNNCAYTLQQALEDLQWKENDYYDRLIFSGNSRKTKSSLQPAIYKAFDCFYQIPTFENVNKRLEPEGLSNKQKEDLIEKTCPSQICKLLIKEIMAVKSIFEPYKDRNEVSSSISALDEMLNDLYSKQRTGISRNLYYSFKGSLKAELTKYQINHNQVNYPFFAAIEDAIDRVKKLPRYSKLKEKIREELLSSHQKDIDFTITRRQDLYEAFILNIKAIRDSIREYNNAENNGSVDRFLDHISKLISNLETDPESFFKSLFKVEDLHYRHIHIWVQLNNLKDKNKLNSSLQKLIEKAESFCDSLGSLIRSAIKLEIVSGEYLLSRLQPKLSQVNPQQQELLKSLDEVNVFPVQQEFLSDVLVEILWKVQTYQGNKSSSAVDGFINYLNEMKAELNSNELIFSKAIYEAIIEELNKEINKLAENNVSDPEELIDSLLAYTKALPKYETIVKHQAIPKLIILNKKPEQSSLSEEVKVEPIVESEEAKENTREFNAYNMLVLKILDIQELLEKESKLYLRSALEKIDSLLKDIHTKFKSGFGYSKDLNAREESNQRYKNYCSELNGILNYLEEDVAPIYSRGALPKIIDTAKSYINELPAHATRTKKLEVGEILIDGINEITHIINKYQEELNSVLNLTMDKSLVDEINKSLINPFLDAMKVILSQIDQDLENNSMEARFYSYDIYTKYDDLLKEELSSFNKTVLTMFSNGSYAGVLIEDLKFFRSKDVFTDKFNSLQNLIKDMTNHFNSMPHFENPTTKKSLKQFISVMGKTNEPTILKQKSYEFLISEIERIKKIINQYQKKDKESFVNKALASIDQLLCEIKLDKDDHVNIKVYYEKHIQKLDSILDKLQKDENQYCDAGFFPSWRRNNSSLQRLIDGANDRLQRLPTIHVLCDRIKQAEVNEELKKEQAKNEPPKKEKSVLKSSSTPSKLRASFKESQESEITQIKGKPRKGKDQPSRESNVGGVLRCIQQGKSIPVHYGASSVNTVFKKRNDPQGDQVTKDLIINNRRSAFNMSGGVDN